MNTLSIQNPSNTPSLKNEASITNNNQGNTNIAKITAQDYLIKRIALTIFGYIKNVFQAIVTLGFAPVHLVKRAYHIVTGYRSTASTAIPQQTTPATQATPKASTPTNEPVQKVNVQQAAPSTTQDTPALMNEVVQKTDTPPTILQQAAPSIQEAPTLTNEVAEKAGTPPTITSEQVVAPSIQEAPTLTNDVVLEASAPEQQLSSALPLTFEQPETPVEHAEVPPRSLVSRIANPFTALASTLPLLYLARDQISNGISSLFQSTQPVCMAPDKYEEFAAQCSPEDKPLEVGEYVSLDDTAQCSPEDKPFEMGDYLKGIQSLEIRKHLPSLDLPDVSFLTSALSPANPVCMATEKSKYEELNTAQCSPEDKPLEIRDYLPPFELPNFGFLFGSQAPALGGINCSSSELLGCPDALNLNPQYGEFQALSIPNELLGNIPNQKVSLGGIALAVSVFVLSKLLCNQSKRPTKDIDLNVDESSSGESSAEESDSEEGTGESDSTENTPVLKTLSKESIDTLKNSLKIQALDLQEEFSNELREPQYHKYHLDLESLGAMPKYTPQGSNQLEELEEAPPIPVNQEKKSAQPQEGPQGQGLVADNLPPPLEDTNPQDQGPAVTDLPPPIVEPEGTQPQPTNPDISILAHNFVLEANALEKFQKSEPESTTETKPNKRERVDPKMIETLINEIEIEESNPATSTSTLGNEVEKDTTNNFVTKSNNGFTESFYNALNPFANNN